MQPTPGEWTASGAYVFAGKNCIGVCDTDNASMQQYAANAKLMAAAKQMLLVLQAVEKSLAESARQLGNVSAQPLLDQVRAAIGKAATE